jgi:hypothetical protein
MIYFTQQNGDLSYHLRAANVIFFSSDLDIPPDALMVKFYVFLFAYK